MVDPGFIPSENLQHFAITSGVLLVQYISGDCFLSLFVYICHHLWHPMSVDLAIASSAITAITLPLPMDRVEHSSSVVRHSLHISPSTQQMLWSNTAVEVKPLCSLWWSAAPPFSASLIHLSITKYHSQPQQYHHTLGANVDEYKMAPHLRQPKPYHCLLFQVRFCIWHFRINCSATTCQATSCD